MNIIQMKKIEKLVYWKVVLQSLMIFEILFLNKWFVFLQKDHKTFEVFHLSQRKFDLPERAVEKLATYFFSFEET